MSNPSLAGSFVQPVQLADYNFNYLRTSDDGTGTGYSYLGGALSLLSVPSSSQSNNTAGTTFNTAGITYLAVDVTVTSFTGGTLPNIQFFVDRLGADNSTYFNVWSSQSFSSAGTNSFDLGPNVAAAAGPIGAQHCVLTKTARLRWVFGGTVSPTAVTLTASIIGR